MNPAVMMVQMDDHHWTQAALRAACHEARDAGGSVVLALLLPESHCILSNIDPAHYEFTETELDELFDYRAIAAEHHVSLTVRVFAYHTLEQGIMDAADAVSATTVFTHMPAALLPFQHDLKVRHLEKVLEEHHHHLRNFEPPIVSAD